MSREVELAVTSGPILENALAAELLYSEKIKLLANVNHGLAKKDSIDLEDLDGVPVILFKFTSRINAVFTKTCRLKGFELKVDGITDAPMTAYHLVEQQNAVGFSTESLYRRLGGERTKILHINNLDLSRQLYLIKLKGGTLSPQARLFEESILRYRDFINTQIT